jgi:quercetin dioxygenase-like cupin family protein
MESLVKVIDVQANPSADGPGHTVCFGKEIAGELLGIKDYAFKYGEFGKGGVSSEHTHDVAEHVFYILEGALSIFVDGNTYTAKAGEAIYVPCKVPHSSANADEGTTKYIALTIPPS